MQAITYIAGGSKGLGASLFEAFKTNNHSVHEFSRSGTDASHIDCDFLDSLGALNIFESTFQKAGKNNSNINLIINTALLSPFGSMTNTNANEINQHLSVNINTSMMLIHSFIKSFQDVEVSKTISYISSGAARRDIPGLAMYSASKAFFERFIDTTAAEQKSCKNPINCMIINPGVMNTGMQSEIRAQSKENFPMVDMWNELHRKGQLANPADIAQVCFNLITATGENGGYYTAQDLI